MSIDPEPVLERMAEAVADATPVDWEAELGRTPAAAATIGNLRLLAALSQVSLAPSDDPAPGAGDASHFRWGPLAALEKLGEGSYGEVWRAWDPSLQRAVALKLRRSSASAGSDRRWLDEARRLARVRHPNVLVVHGADVHDGRFGLWTDLLHGATLETILRERGTMGAREAGLVGVELCSALAAVHAAGLVHGDVKASNVMREGEAGEPDGSGRIVLMDFGSAHEAAPPGAAGGAALFGTPLAVAPEVLAGATPTARSDVYSLGALLYRLVAGRHPIEAASLGELAERAARGERTPLRAARPELPVAFVQAVERALEPDPARRTPDPAALEAALLDAIAPATGTAAAPARRSLPGPALVAAAIVVVAAAALWFARGDAPAPRVAAPEAPRPNSTQAPAAGAPANAPAPDVAPVPPQVTAVLVRGGEDAREELRDGEVVGPGDRIALELEAREAVHAYVVSEDARGETFVLFPLGSRGAHNPLAAGVRHRLPGRAGGEDLDWVVTSAGGSESFLVLAARDPIARIEQAIAGLPVAEEGAPIRLPRRASAGTRGIGGVAGRPSTSSTAPPRGLLALMEELGRQSDAAIWMHLVTLENPGP